MINTLEASIQEAFDVQEKRKMEDQYSPEFISDMDLISIFKPISIIKENILEYKSNIKAINKEYDKTLVRMMSIKSISFDKNISELFAVRLWVDFFNPIILNFEKQLKRLDRLLQLSKKNVNDNKGITEEDVIRAKSIPIDSLIEFDRTGSAKCIWHDDRHPSLKLYRKENRCWCFACNQGGDAIDVVRKIYEVDFIQAVKKLINKQ